LQVSTDISKIFIRAATGNLSAQHGDLWNDMRTIPMCLQFIAQRKQEQHHIGASVLLKDMYVDDLLTRADSID